MISGLVASVVAVGFATAFGLWRRGRDGLLRSLPAGAVTADVGGERAAAVPGRDVLGPDDLGAILGSRATLVQFSSAFCAPCRATRRILSEVAGMVEGVRHVEIDVAARLDLVRRLGVRRTPTTFVLGPDGQVTHRASGQPRKADVVAALGAVLDFPT